MASKRGGVRKKGKVGSKNWKDPYAPLKPDKSMARRKWDVVDIQEYVHTLSEEDKLWMARFMREYNNASLDFENLENNLHNTPELKKACTDRNNERNRCIYTRENAKGLVDLVPTDSELENLIYGDTTSDAASFEGQEDELDSWVDQTRADD